jgi:cell division protein FtsL
MRAFLIFIAIVLYLFLLVFIESELVQLEVRKEDMENRLIELQNQKKILEFEVMDVSNLVRIEAEARARGFIFPTEDDILGAVK